MFLSPAQAANMKDDLRPQCYDVTAPTDKTMIGTAWFVVT